MARVDCSHEDDVLTMVTTGQWPERAPAELRAHVAGCELCRELAMAASAIDAEASVRPLPDLPSAGTVWWRAQLRARQEAARDAVRPITFAQAVGLAALAGVAGALFGASVSWFQDALRTVNRGLSLMLARLDWPSMPAVAVPDSLSSVGFSYWIVLAAVAVGVITAVIVMGWAFREE